MMNLVEKTLSGRQRKSLPGSQFVFKKDRRYPISDKAHARNALARVSQHGTSDEKARVRAAVKIGFYDNDIQVNSRQPKVK